MAGTLEQRTGTIAVALGVAWIVVSLGLALFGVVAWASWFAVAFRGVLVVMGLAALSLLGGFVFGHGAPQSAPARHKSARRR